MNSVTGSTASSSIAGDYTLEHLETYSLLLTVELRAWQLLLVIGLLRGDLMSPLLKLAVSCSKAGLD